MSELTLNGGAAILRAHFHLPLAGVWSCDLEVDTDEDITGAVTLEVDGVETFRGTVTRGGVDHGAWCGRIVGGAAGLRGDLPALAYLNATFADVVRDALAEAGETLSTTSSTLAVTVARFHRAEGAAARAVQATADALGYGWRVLADGTVWLGAETWPASPEASLSLLDSNAQQRRYILGGDVLAIRPGQLLQVRDEAADVFVRCGAVTLDVEPDHFTATVWVAP